MSKIQVAGNSVTIISGLTPEDIKLAQKYNPKVLGIYVDEEKENIVFKVAFAPKHGAVSDKGITYDSVTNTEGAQKACVSIIIKDDYEDITKYIQDQYGMEIMKLNQVEDAVSRSLGEIREQHEKIKAAIEIKA